MKAFHVEAPHKFALIDVPPPQISEDEVLVRVGANGICGSDLDVLEGIRPDFCTRYPCVLGHEFAGVIAECGGAARRFRPGDKVVVDPIVHCMACGNCRKGWTCHCEQGYDQLGFTRPGGMQEYTAVPQNLAYKLPEGIDLAAAALIEPFSCAANGVRKAVIQPGDSIVVIGLGAIGAGALQIARLFSPTHIMVVEVDERKRSAAHKLGATEFLNPQNEDLPSRVRELTKGKGTNAVIDCSGNLTAVRQSFSYLATKGRVVMIGIPDRSEFEIPFFKMLQNDASFFASAGHTTPIWSWVLKLLENGHFDTDSVITHRIPLREVDRAFSVLRERSECAIKVTVCP
jgi:L-gulonate 5-dehydrogenase